MASANDLSAFSSGRCAKCRERYEQGSPIAIVDGRTFHAGCAPKTSGGWVWSAGTAPQTTPRLVRPVLAAPPKKLAHKYDGDEACPICGFEYVHIQSVRVQQDTHVATVNSLRDGGVQERIVPSPGARGSTVSIRFWCENGHVYEREFSFRKGTVMRAHREVGFIDPDGEVDFGPGAPGEDEGEDENDELPRSTLWRD